jgi:hypothetical protein
MSVSNIVFDPSKQFSKIVKVIPIIVIDDLWANLNPVLLVRDGVESQFRVSDEEFTQRII